MNSESKVTNWRKATASANGSGCVEVGSADNQVFVRDTTRREAGSIAASSSAWAAFIDGVKTGDYELS